jgi:hypothetical protein
MRAWSASVRRRFNERATIYHKRFITDCVVLAFLLFTMGCLWFSVGRWICLGALLMFLPKLLVDAERLLDIELLRDRLGMEPPARGRHARRHSGAHPRPGARNKA